MRMWGARRFIGATAAVQTTYRIYIYIGTTIRETCTCVHAHNAPSRGATIVYFRVKHCSRTHIYTRSRVIYNTYEHIYINICKCFFPHRPSVRVCVYARPFPSSSCRAYIKRLQKLLFERGGVERATGPCGYKFAEISDPVSDTCVTRGAPNPPLPAQPLYLSISATTTPTLYYTCIMYIYER